MSSSGIFLVDLGITYKIYDAHAIAYQKKVLSDSINLQEWLQALGLPPATLEKSWERLLARVFLGQMMGLEFPQDLKKMQLNKEYQLKNLTHIQSSFSHHSQCIACCYTEKKSTFIGIDIEPFNRTIRSNSLKYFAHPQDAPQEKENLLSLWVKKEAAFKAISHHLVSKSKEQKIQGLYQIRVDKLYFSYQSLTETVEGKFYNLSNDDSVCYLAVISPTIHTV